MYNFLIYYFNRVNQSIRDKGRVPAKRLCFIEVEGLILYNQDQIYIYITLLLPLKEATKKLKGYSYSRYNRAIQEVIPIYNQLLQLLEDQKEYLKDTYKENYLNIEAIKDYLIININNSQKKLNKYFKLLRKLAIYYTTIVLHPLYKLFYQNLQANRPSWIRDSDTGLNKLWAQYKDCLIPSSAHPPPSSPSVNSTKHTTAHSGQDDYIQLLIRLLGNNRLLAIALNKLQTQRQQPLLTKSHLLANNSI